MLYNPVKSYHDEFMASLLGFCCAFCSYGIMYFPSPLWLQSASKVICLHYLYGFMSLFMVVCCILCISEQRPVFELV